MKLVDIIKCNLINLKSFLFRKKHRVSLYKNIFRITDANKDEIYIARLNRHNRYKKSINTGVDLLAKDYLIDKLVFSKDDLIVDCGANVGELAYWAKKKSLNYIGFEPEENEFKCLGLNSSDKFNIFRNALWNKNEELTFYSLPNSGDSSAFEINNPISRFKIQGKRLDQMIKIKDYSGLKVLKVEAEGAEPEVLEGAINIINDFDYITVDCGPERGMSQDYTFIPINSFLINLDFKLVDCNFDRVTMLYKNTKKQ